MLAIRTDKPDAELYLFDGQNKLAAVTWLAHRQLAETLHIKIDELLSSQGISSDMLKKIGVYQGPGSFTGLRIGISAANAYAYGLQIPIVGATGDDWIETCITMSGTQDTVNPIYGSEPHITQQKK